VSEKGEKFLPEAVVLLIPSFLVKSIVDARGAEGGLIGTGKVA